MNKYKVLADVEIEITPGNLMPYAPSEDPETPNIIELESEVAAPFVEAGQLEAVEETAPDPETAAPADAEDEEEDEEEDGEDEDETSPQAEDVAPTGE